MCYSWSHCVRVNYTHRDFVALYDDDDDEDDK